MVYKSQIFTKFLLRSLQVTNAYDGRQEGAVKDPLARWVGRSEGGMVLSLRVFQSYSGMVGFV